MRPYPTYILSVCLILLVISLPARSFAQCAGGTQATFITYDTLVFGGGNDNFNLKFPQFDPSLGTSVSVRLDTYVTLRYSFELENYNSTGSNHTVRVSRTDAINYPAGNIEKTDRRNLGPYLLAGTDGVVNSGPDYVADGPLLVFQNFHNVYTVTNNVVPFLGNGTIDVEYITESTANVVGNLNSTLHGDAIDTVIFKLSYFYCPTTNLPADLTNFSAKRDASGDIHIRWYSPSDYIGKRFEIEKSVDGRKFEMIAQKLSNSNTGTYYDHYYHPTADDKTKVFFRIKEYDPDGSFYYSVVRDVNIPYNDTKMKVYPTAPTGSVQVFFPLAVKADYDVSIVSMMGQVMQRSAFYRTNLFRVNFNRTYPPGTYIVYVVNKQTLEKQQSKIIIQ